MVGESIYQWIMRMSEEYPGLPYQFQDVDIAGKRDILYIFWQDEGSAFQKEKMDLDLVGLLVDCLENQVITDELQQLLEVTPIFLYLTSLVQRLKLYLSEQMLDDKKLYTFGLRLATQSEFEEEVKLGILILGFFENDVVRQIIKKLGFHSAFTLYAVEASNNFKQPNAFVYEIAQHTRGYGKMFALHLLEPIHQKQQQWFFEKGAVNEVAPNLSAFICLEKIDMVGFFENLVITEKTFSKLSYLLAYGAENDDVKLFTQSLMLVEKYSRVAEKFVKSFIDLAALVAVEKSMFPYWEESGVNVEKENGWSSDKENEVRNVCNKIIGHSKWRYILFEELGEPQQKTSLILLTLEKLKVTPAFEMFAQLLQRDFFDMDLLNFLLVEHPKKYLEDVYHFLQQVLPEEVLDENPQEILEDEITPEHQPDIWLVFLLKEMRQAGWKEEDFYLRCILCRFPDVRIEAIQALGMFKKEWSELVLPRLESACENEPITKIRKRLLRLIGKVDIEKEQRFVDVSATKVTPLTGDTCVITTTIAGTFYRDLCVIEGQIEAGDTLYLIREPENAYDDKAILVTTDGGYVVGYIPQTVNMMLAYMMDHSEKLYAILVSEQLERGKPTIQIMLSTQEKQQGQVLNFIK